MAAAPAAPVYTQTRRIADELIQSAQSFNRRLPTIHFDLIDSGKINAVAFKVDNDYFIGVTAGAVCMLHLLIDRTLCSPRAFTDIGSPQLESSDVPIVPWQFRDAEQLYNLGVRPVPPRCTNRRIFARHIAEQAILFLIGHEIAHISRGHVDYQKSLTGSAFVLELTGEQSSTERGGLTSQALEADADGRSMASRCDSALRTAANSQSKVPPWGGSPRDAAHWQIDWMFAVNAVFRIFGDPAFSDVDLVNQCYPPFPLRRRMTMEHAGNLLFREYGKESVAEIKELIVHGLKITEDAFRAIGAPTSEGGLMESTTQAAIEHIQKVNNRWNEIRDDVAVFSYEQL